MDSAAGFQPRQALRDQHMADLAVFVGGVNGCGKSMLTPVIGSLERLEIQKYNYTIEHICSLHYLGRMPDDSAKALLSLQADMVLYDLMHGREVNIRYKDCSSIFSNPGTLKYLARLTTQGGAEALVRIKSERPVLHILTHNVMTHSVPLLMAMGERGRIVEVVRHPLYMVKQWHIYIEHFAAEARNLTLWFGYEGRALPFWAWGWEEQYVKSSKMDRVIYALQHITEANQRRYEQLTDAQRARTLRIPFERFVLEPEPWLQALESLLGTKRTAETMRELKRQNVPRKLIAQGINLPIYKAYGWEPPEEGATERRELDKRRAFAAASASPEALKVLDRLSAAYEAEYLKGVPGL